MLSTNPRRFYGTDPTESEQASGEAIAAENLGPMKPNRRGHQVLWVFRDGQLMTAYDASMLCSGDHHAVRRECHRLLVRGFLRKHGHLPNQAPGGRKRGVGVDAYMITQAGLNWLFEHGEPS